MPRRGFWNTLKRTITIKENGHDSIVYFNQAEGPGDSYVIFDPKKVTPRFGPQLKKPPFGGLAGVPFS
jgi:hypothetical protein